jgi:GT2 family glycosyltransferase
MLKIDHILGVLVLYNTGLKESRTVKCLNNALGKVHSRLNLLVYDNSALITPGEIITEYENFIINYINDPSNPGLAKAYNEGYRHARESNKDWILLLDQDTEFRDDFFEILLKAAVTGLDDQTVCLIPRVFSAGTDKMISPVQITPGGFIKPLRNTSSGFLKGNNITGINSGTLLRTGFLGEIGGFNDQYPLDMQDHWYFREIMRRNLKIFLLDSSIMQDLSVSNFEENISVSRYKSILSSEHLFFRHNMIDFIFYKIKLFARAIRQLFYKDKDFFNASLEYLMKF